ncbi:MAG TPA: hypothetical protein VMO17_09090 [Terriglobia bacterium]|nr:hypothetical protein [Terriglobia bacterium]
MPKPSDKFAPYAVVLLILGGLARFPMMILLRHTSFLVYCDNSYLQAGQAMLQLDFHALGMRTPVYPFLLALCGLRPGWIWFAQSLLGMAASLMIFDMVFRRTGHALYALLVGLVCSLTPEVLTYESSVMSEALTSFLLVSSFWLITREETAGEPRRLYLFALGSTIALTALTRPLMVCLVPVYYCFLVPPWPPGRILQREFLKRTLYFALPATLGIMGWCGFNYVVNGYFSPSTRSGGNLMDQVDAYVELAPERFANLRDAWIHSRQRVNGGSVNVCAIGVYGDVVAEMQRRTGKTEAQTSHEFAALALYLQVHHPLLCLRRAEQGWMQFWGAPTRDEIEWPQGNTFSLGEFLMTLIGFLIRQVEAVFLVLALLSIPCVLFYQKVFTRIEYLAFAVTLWVSAFAAFTEFGENRRFCVPFYMLIVYILMTRAWVWITAPGGPTPPTVGGQRCSPDGTEAPD